MKEAVIKALQDLIIEMKRAGLEHLPVTHIINEIKRDGLYDDTDLERAFCGGFIANMKSIHDFDNNRLSECFNSFKTINYDNA